MKKVLILVAAGIVLSSLSGCTAENTNSPAVSVTESTVVSAEQSVSEQTPEPETESSEPTPEPVVEKPVIKVESLTLSAYEKTLTVGERFMPIVTMQPQNATNKGEIWQSDNTAVATVNRHGNITAVGAGNCKVTVTSADNSAVSAEFSVTVNAPVQIEPKYIDGILIVNKTYPLPSNYTDKTNPQSGEARAKLNEMFAAAAVAGHTNMRISSGYRSYSTQQSLYNKYVRRDGAAAADRYSARPGYSEHQTGLAFDIIKAGMTSDQPTLDSWAWLAEHAHEYGFILRYPDGKESVTGYQSEPWHYRYVGVENAQKIHATGLTLEEYFGINSRYAQ